MPLDSSSNTSVKPARRLMLQRGDVAAIVALIVLSLAMFGPHLLGWSTFIGNSDRLNTFLSIRKLEVDNLKALGQVSAWTDAIYMGAPVYSLYWMQVAVDPSAALLALFPSDQIIRLAGFITAGHVVLAALAAYLFMRDVVDTPFTAAVGAGLYVCSAFAVHRISQVDSAYAVLIYAPLGLWVLRKTRPGRTAAAAVGMSLLIGSLVAFTFIQDAVYVLILICAYAAYRALIRRDWRPLAVVAVAGFASMLLTAPRLGTIVQDIPEALRSSALFTTCPCEVLRWFDDGIFGRYPQEAGTFGNATINLHEGVQLYTSVFAALLVIVGLLRPRGLAAVISGGVFLFTLVIVARPIGGRADVNNLFLVLAALLTAWAFWRWHAARRAARPRGYLLNDPDVPFCILFSAAAFAVILSDPVRYLVYLLFFKIDFSHSRITVAALPLICTLAAIFLRDAFGPSEIATRPARSHLIALVLAAAAAVGVLLVLDPLVDLVAQARLNDNDRLRVDSWLSLPVSISLRQWTHIWLVGIILAVVLALGWLARRTNDPARASSMLRLLPAYVLGCLLAFHSFSNAYFQVNGRHTDTFPNPFVLNNNFTVPVYALRPPTPAALQAVRKRLETDDFRSTLVESGDQFPSKGTQSEHGYTTHVATFWQLRVVDGYPILPRRLVDLPWVGVSRTLRSLYFNDPKALDWPLLALLNVKYAVSVNPALFYNRPADPSSRRTEARADDLEVQENPLPVLPRAFFTRSVVPRDVPTVGPTILPRDALMDLLAVGPMQQSLVDGFEAPMTFGSADGPIEATYAGDRVSITVEPSDQPRFLVLNELYHPGWRAYAGNTELRVWPTNVVMRGVLVPPGTTQIAMRFVPFFMSWTALGCVVAGALLLAASWAILRRLDERTCPSSPLHPAPALSR